MNNQLILLIVAGTVGLMLMAFSLVFFVSLYKRRVLQNRLRLQEMQTLHQQEMLKATLASQEEERNRLGTDLHDGVGAMLSTIKMNLQVSQRTDSLKTLPEVIEHLTETISLVRTISHEMMPIVLKKYGLRRAITDLFEKVSNSDLVTASIDVWDEFDWEESDSLILYRIIQELTNNSLKHSEAKNIKLKCTISEENATIVFSDDGKGFPPEVLEKSQGIGLWNISNRAVAIGAGVVFRNNQYGSAEVELNIKLNRAND
ncbi:MAG: ATP-binding protein [Cyclobacteriaceae bacterium]